ncbi:fasciclin-3-like isoform X6 [Daphnia pulex]|uniref:fasciclin-3-like isoform X6 n=1 Tax=Daphnia pulex TaxID=6669 RepID=UPI001EE01A5F|nr:fasciclin-3-like isoform X6 [Daphnia pulex]
MTRLSFIGLFLLIGVAICQVTIEPQNIVVRQDQVTRLMCKTRTPIKSCLWEINGDLYNLAEGSPYEPLGVLEDGECGIQARITDMENGVWACRVFLSGTSRSPAERASTNVTVLALPQISLRPRDDPITVIAGENAQIDCMVADARPAPAITWVLGDRDLDFTNTQTVMEPRPASGDSKVSITSKLNYAFQAVDHGKLLRCVTNGPWLSMDDPRETFAQLNVIFPPQPKGEMTLYDFVLGQPGDITVNFTANPRPSSVAWKLDSETELAVEPFTGRSSDPRVEVFELKSLNATSFEARLRIKTLGEADARRIFRLIVESSMMNGEAISQEYTVRLSTSPAPAQSGGVSGAGVAAIVIVIVAILVVTAVVLYARNTGRWCFAGEGESQARIDEENPGEIVKEKEGKEGPLKGSNENLNLQLAGPDGAENGNGQLPASSPIKESQQQTNGGTTPDGKDTAV